MSQICCKLGVKFLFTASNFATVLYNQYLNPYNEA
jgi:hypothetical protein